MRNAVTAALRRFALPALLATLLLGCGQTGPLYLPQDATTDVSTTAPTDPADEESDDEERRSP